VTALKTAMLRPESKNETSDRMRPKTVRMGPELRPNLVQIISLLVVCFRSVTRPSRSTTCVCPQSQLVRTRIEQVRFYGVCAKLLVARIKSELVHVNDVCAKPLRWSVTSLNPSTSLMCALGP